MEAKFKMKAKILDELMDDMDKGQGSSIKRGEPQQSSEDHSNLSGDSGRPKLSHADLGEMHHAQEPDADEPDADDIHETIDNDSFSEDELGDSKGQDRDIKKRVRQYIGK